MLAMTFAVVVAIVCLLIVGSFHIAGGGLWFKWAELTRIFSQDEKCSSFSHL